MSCEIVQIAFICPISVVLWAVIKCNFCLNSRYRAANRLHFRLAMSVGVPIKVLHDAEGHIVTLETVTGEIFRGKLIEAEDNMNIHMQEIIMTARDGKTSSLQHVYIRGSKIRYCFFNVLTIKILNTS